MSWAKKVYAPVALALALAAGTGLYFTNSSNTRLKRENSELLQESMNLSNEGAFEKERAEKMIAELTQYRDRNATLEEELKKYKNLGPYEDVTNPVDKLRDLLKIKEDEEVASAIRQFDKLPFEKKVKMAREEKLRQSRLEYETKKSIEAGGIPVPDSISWNEFVKPPYSEYKIAWTCRQYTAVKVNGRFAGTELFFEHKGHNARAHRFDASYINELLDIELYHEDEKVRSFTLNLKKNTTSSLAKGINSHKCCDEITNHELEEKSTAYLLDFSEKIGRRQKEIDAIMEDAMRKSEKK